MRHKMNMEAVIEARNFTKTYGDFVAVDDISFEVGRGEIFGLLGPNGAGKTSTLESLEGLRRVDGGFLSVMGVNPAREPGKLRDIIGVQLQTSGLPDCMRVAEVLKFFSAYHGIAPPFELLDRLGLAEKRDAEYHALSTGLQRRLALAVALAHRPPVIFLDEPTAGLDVPSRNEIHRLVKELQANGATTVLATHDMAEAEKLADRVAILLRGRIVATGTPRELTATGSSLTKVSVLTENGAPEQLAADLPGVSQTAQKDDYIVFYTSNPGATVAAIISGIEARHDTLIDLRVERPSLEERFLEITGTGSSL